MGMMNELIAYRNKQRAKRLDNWLISNWVTKDNFLKFKIKVEVWVHKETYSLYPARWRNANKLIDSFIYEFTIN